MSDATIDSDSDGRNNLAEYGSRSSLHSFPMAKAAPIPPSPPLYRAYVESQADLINIDFTPDINKARVTGAGAVSVVPGDQWNVFHGLSWPPSSTDDPIVALRTGLPLTDAGGVSSGVVLRVGRGYGVWTPSEPFNAGSCMSLGQEVRDRSKCFEEKVREAFVGQTDLSKAASGLPCASSRHWTIPENEDPSVSEWWYPHFYWWATSGAGGVVFDNSDPLSMPYLYIEKDSGNAVFMEYALDGGLSFLPPGPPPIVVRPPNTDIIPPAHFGQWGAIPPNVADFLQCSVDRDNCWQRLGAATGKFYEAYNNTVLSLSGLSDNDYWIYVAAVGPAGDGQSDYDYHEAFVCTGLPSDRWSTAPYGQEGSALFTATSTADGWHVFYAHPQQGQLRIVLPSPVAINAIQVVKVENNPPPPPSNRTGFVLTAEGQYKAVNLSWTPVQGADFYQVMRAPANLADPALYFFLDYRPYYNTSETGLVDSYFLPPWPGVTYWYYVVAYSGFGAGKKV
ncbi:MAG TPA: hypothetical protein VF607_03150, partial [Verrucomicrobiae bacterium]